MRRWVCGVALLVAGCAPGATPSATATATPATSPSSPAPSSSPPLATAVVLDAVGSISQQPQVSHVVVVGLDGALLASADFLPPPNVGLGPAATIYPPPVRVAGGHVYFTDGTGHIQQLTARGATPVATIPVPAGVEYTLSFGVAPDGQEVVAAVNRFGTSAGADLFRAAGGGTARLIGHLAPAGSSPPTQLIVEGFDGDAVVAAADTYAAIQNDPWPAGHEFAGGRLVRLTADGQIGSSYGGADCKPFRWFGDSVICADQLQPDAMTGVTLRRGDQTVLMRLTKTDGCAVPSPDSKRIATRGALWSADGTATSLPIDACPLAWIDSGHLLATANAGGGPLGMVDPFVLTIADSTRKPIGQKGYFVGMASL